MEVFLNPNAWIALLTLTFLEIVLGIDNIIFISIATGKLPIEQRKKATKLGMFLAMFMRIALLFGISLLIAMKEPWLSFDLGWFSGQITGQSLILLLGGLFLLYKSTNEIREKVDEKGQEEKELRKSAAKSFGNVIFQIILIDIVFSFDSILTAIGLVSAAEPPVGFGTAGAIEIMIMAIIISIIIMMIFAGPVSKFVNNHPTIQILGLSFLISNAYSGSIIFPFSPKKSFFNPTNIISSNSL